MFRTEILGINGCGKPMIAAVASDDGAAVVARFEAGVWRPAYGIKRSGEDMALPSCFELHPEAQKALDQLRTI